MPNLLNRRPVIILLVCLVFYAPGCKHKDKDPAPLSALVPEVHWTQVNGPGAGNVFSLGIKGDVAVASTPDGLYSSNNHGVWHLANNGVTFTSAGFKSVASNDRTFFCGNENGVYKSVNGQLWSLANAGLTNTDVRCLLVNGDRTFCGTGSGIFLTSDDGDSWSSIGLPKAIITMITSGDTVLAATTEGVYRTANNGDSWTLSNTGLADFLDDRVTAFSKIGSRIFAGMSQGGIYVSTDRGDSWTFSLGGEDLIFIGAITTLAARASTLYAGCQKGIIATSDFGASWTLKMAGVPTNKITTIINDGTDLMAGTAENGVLLSTDGENWKTHGLPINTLSAISANGKNVITRANNNDALYFSKDGGETWKPVPTSSDSPGNVKQILATPDYFLVTSSYGGLYRLSVSSETWTGIIVPEITDLCYAANTLIIGTATGVVKSLNYGDDRVAINNGLTDLEILKVATDGTNVLAVTASGIFISKNGGGTWTSVDSDLVTHEATTFKRIGDYWFAGEINNGVYKSSDGIHWKEVFPSYFNLTDFSSDGNNIYVATLVKGVYVSPDFGATWTQENDGLLRQYTQCITVGSDRVYLGTNANGVYFSLF